MKTLALLMLLFAVPLHARATRTIVMIGEATTYGYNDGPGPGGQSITPPAVALQALLRLLPVGNPWRNATVLTRALPAALTSEWIQHGVRYDYYCAVNQNWPPLEAAACAGCNNPGGNCPTPLLSIVESITPRPDLVLLNVGIADTANCMIQVIQGLTDETTCLAATTDNIRVLKAALNAWAPTYLSAPLQVNAAGGAIAATQEAYREQLIAMENAVQILDGPTWPLLPTDESNVYLTDGGYCAVAGLWFDIVEAIP